MATLGKQIAMSAKNVASDFYNGAVKGVKKADFTVNKVIKKNQMPTNLNNAASKKAMLKMVRSTLEKKSDRSADDNEALRRLTQGGCFVDLNSSNPLIKDVLDER